MLSLKPWLRYHALWASTAFKKRSIFPGLISLTRTIAGSPLQGGRFWLTRGDRANVRAAKTIADRVYLSMDVFKSLYLVIVNFITRARGGLVLRLGATICGRANQI